jgi:hypothetical protein
MRGNTSDFAADKPAAKSIFFTVAPHSHTIVELYEII